MHAIRTAQRVGGGKQAIGVLVATGLSMLYMKIYYERSFASERTWSTQEMEEKIATHNYPVFNLDYAAFDHSVDSHIGWKKIEEHDEDTVSAVNLGIKRHKFLSKLLSGKVSKEDIEEFVNEFEGNEQGFQLPIEDYQLFQRYIQWKESGSEKSVIEYLGSKVEKL